MLSFIHDTPRVIYLIKLLAIKEMIVNLCILIKMNNYT